MILHRFFRLLYKSFNIKVNFNKSVMSIYPDEQRFLWFLENKKFIEWKLFPTDELNAYWKDFLEKNPEEQLHLKQADEHFRNINLSSHSVSEEKKQKAVERLTQSLQRYNRNRKLRILTYAASACMALLILSAIYLKFIKPENKFIASTDVIIGNEMNSQDIQLIANNQTAIFRENIDLQIAQNGTAQINTEGCENQEIAIDTHELNKLIVPYGKRSKVQLADGTKVWLNSGSSLKFPSSFESSKREVWLSGEMYIEVAPDKQKPFIVYTDNFHVRVLGTKFNVSAYTNYTNSVALLEGSVRLKSENENEMELSPNQQAIVENGVFRKETVNTSDVIGWIDGYLVFRKAPISEVLAQVSRYYNLSFNFDNDMNLQKRTCSGKLSLSDNLDDVMNTIALLSGTNYNRKEKTIYISNKK